MWFGLSTVQRCVAVRRVGKEEEVEIMVKWKELQICVCYQNDGGPAGVP